MAKDEGATGNGSGAGLELKEEDIMTAMREIPGYLDITPRDFKEIYLLAFQHALERLSREVAVGEIMTREVVRVKRTRRWPRWPQPWASGGFPGCRWSMTACRWPGWSPKRISCGPWGWKTSQNFMALVASCLRSKGCVALPIKKQTAGDLMSAPAVTVRPETRVRELAELFAARHINRAPVTDAAGRLVGIVSRGDLVRATLKECRL